MTCLGKWLLASCALHLLAAAGLVLLVATAHKPVAVIDLSQLGHSWHEPAPKQAGGGAVQELAALAQPLASEKPEPCKVKRRSPPRRLEENFRPTPQSSMASDAVGDNASLTAAGPAVAGSNGHGTEGSGGKVGGQGSDYRSMYFGYITELVQKAAAYPLQARRMCWQGTVIVSFVIQKNGSITDVVVIESSGHAVLDGSALAAVKKIGPLHGPPEIVEIRLPVVYRMTGA